MAGYTGEWGGVQLGKFEQHIDATWALFSLVGRKALQNQFSTADSRPRSARTEPALNATRGCQKCYVFWPNEATGRAIQGRRPRSTRPNCWRSRQGVASATFPF